MDAPGQFGAAGAASERTMSSSDHSHARRNQLSGEWVLVSPHRTQRPWQGQLEKTGASRAPEYDANCYLCPGNSRAGGAINSDYRGTFVFNNDYPALSSMSEIEAPDNALFEARAETGCCRVLCYTERHDLSIATMAVKNIVVAIQAMILEFRKLDSKPEFRYVQMFENRGEMMGCSNQHPHAQIWATRNLPNEPQKELQSQRAYFSQHGSPLLTDYLAAEIESADRVVTENEHFVALVPYWAIWPFELLLLPRRHFASPEEMGEHEILALAQVLKAVFSTYNRLFEVEMPYSMGFHPRPSDGAAHPEWRFHAHVYPPLLRSATVRKHFVGFEMLGMPQRDLTPEVAAQRLRSVCL